MTNSEIMLYTFRTFPPELLENAVLGSVFRFGSLKKDLVTFEELVELHSPKRIVGFALSDHSRQEAYAINQFNNAKVLSSGPEIITLDIIENSPFLIATHPTWSFCNWTMFRIGMNHSLSFFHIKPDDFNAFANWISNLAN